MSHRNTKISALVLGAFSVYVQTIMLREIFAAYGFSELLFAIILFFWLFCGGLGSYTYRKGSIPNQFAILGIWGIFIPLIVRVIAVLLRPQLGITVPITIVIITGALSSLLAIFVGRTFAALAKLGDAHKLYALEGIGSFTGGILSILFVGFLSRSFLILIAFALLVPIYTAGIKAMIRYIVIIAVGTFIITFSIPEMNKLLWKGYEASELESHYGRITLVSREGENYIYENGKLIASQSDTLSSEQIVHPVMWAHPNPKKVLLIGGIFNGAGIDIIKHNPDSLFLPFMDRKLIASAIARLPSIRNFWDQQNLYPIYSEPRQFLRNSDTKFDVIFSMPGFPNTGGDNRFWTVEWFDALRKHLHKNGIIAVEIPVGANFLSEYQQELCASIWKTFHYVFPKSEIYFLDGAILMVSHPQSSLNLRQKLINKKNFRQINTATINPQYLPMLFQKQRSETLTRQLNSAKFARINRNWHPMVYLWGILEQSNLAGAKVPLEIFQNGERKSSVILAIILVILLLLSIIFKKNNFIFWVFASGMWGMLAQTLFILIFQANFGN
ncbi:hypothetical protein DRQ33_06165, partial [bacterium]